MTTQDAPAPVQDGPSCPPLEFPSNVELATNPPPRQFFVLKRLPPQVECERAIDIQPGDPDDTLRSVYIAARIHLEGDAEDKLAYDFLYAGQHWPVALRTAILNAYSICLYFEHRLAAIEKRDAVKRKGPPPLILTAE